MNNEDMEMGIWRLEREGNCEYGLNDDWESEKKEKMWKNEKDWNEIEKKGETNSI